MSNDTYQADVKRVRQEFLRLQTEQTTERLARFFYDGVDSIALHGLADELEGLSRMYREVSEQAVEEHLEAAQRKLQVGYLVENRRIDE